jgi:hypothetical protein
MNTLPTSLKRYANRLDGGVDVDQDGWKTIYARNGWQFDTDPLTPMHIAGADTVRELALCCKYMIRCDCKECKGEK